MESVAKGNRGKKELRGREGRRGKEGRDERRRFNFLIRRRNGAPTEFYSPLRSSSKLRMNGVFFISSFPRFVYRFFFFLLILKIS